jgi:cyanate lyase
MSAMPEITEKLLSAKKAKSLTFTDLGGPTRVVV